MNILKKSILALALLQSTGCVTLKGPYNRRIARESQIPIEQRIETSNQIQEERRKEANSFTLTEKKVIFETLWEYHRMPPPFQHSKKRRLEEEPQKKSRIEPHFMVQDLLAVANRAIVTENIAYITEGNNTLEALLYFDKNFGQEGQMPDRVFITKDKPTGKHTPYELEGPKISEYRIFLMDDAHGNTMHYHMQALFEMHKAVTHPSFTATASAMEGIELLATQAKRSISYLLHNEFVMRNPDGTKATYGDLSGKGQLGFAKNATLAKLMILESGLEMLGDRLNSQTALDIQEELKKEIREGSLSKISDMGSTIGNISFSSYASDRRVFHNLWILADIGKNREYGNVYEEAFENYYTQKRHEQNPFYTFAYLSQKDIWDQDDYADANIAIQRLETIPLSRRNQEVINSFNPQIPHNRFSLIRKHGLIPMAKKPLPYWQQGTSGNAWKERPHALDFNMYDKNPCLQNPQDFLLAMYMAEQLGLIPEGEQKQDQNKISTYLERVRPQYERAYHNTHPHISGQ